MSIVPWSTRIKAIGSLALLTIGGASYFASPGPYSPQLSERAKRFGVLDERRREINRMDLEGVLLASPEVLEGMKNEMREFNSLKDDTVLQAELKTNYDASTNNNTKVMRYGTLTFFGFLIGVSLGLTALSEYMNNRKKTPVHTNLSDQSY